MAVLKGSILGAAQLLGLPKPTVTTTLLGDLRSGAAALLTALRVMA